ncbi:ATPase [Pseudomonas muyukensis]|uniref:ATPase n=1 Tax=Pseudomonas muyukensis TaxID=2842357 RepID=A0ABX8M3C1_9PSED|nr:ATPase [Pseudomonas muyukensis]QXH33312.1 ATPase [Pseudomonas muyukensis]
MKTGMIAALLALLAALSGCAVPASQQAAQPYGHFYSATELSSVALNHGQHVAVLLGRNAAATLDYLQRHRDQARAGSATATPVATLGHNQAYAWLAQSLAQQFAEVTFYDDLDTLLADHPDVIVLLDSHSRLASAGIEASVVARFFDDQLTYIGRAEGLAVKQASAQALAGQLAEEQAVQADALRQFDASLQLLLHNAA